MLAELVLLYASPFFVRAGLGPAVAAHRVLLSLLPIAVVAPAPLLTRVLRDPEREHVARHTLYAVAFTLSAATAVRWDVVWPARDEAWARALLLYLLVGAVTLWWFVLSHVLENAGLDTLHTHHGDVAVLPLTLVAIATFAESVPDEAFQFSRSIVYFTPVVVAWATLQFVGFTGFARSRTTTHEHPAFRTAAALGTVLGITHLVLLEARATSVAFLFLPGAGALVCQMTADPTRPPPMRPGRLPGMLVAQALASGGLAAVFRAAGYRGVDAVVAPIAVSCVAAAGVPLGAGRRWVVPAAVLDALVTSVYFARAGHPVDAADVVAFVAGFYVACRATDAVAPPVDTQPTTPARRAPGFLQSAAFTGPVSACLAPCDRVPVPACVSRGTEAAAAALAARPVDQLCPAALAGVWWTQTATLPTVVTAVHGHRWHESADGARVTCYGLMRHTGRAATLGGVLLAVQSACRVMHLVWHPGDDWTRTKVYVFPVLRWFPNTLWVVRIGPDEMRRVWYTDEGAVRYQYDLVRVLRPDGTRTSHYPAFARAHGATRCVLG